MTDTHVNHIDLAVARSVATEHAGLHFQGGHLPCPYKAGSRERAAYDEQYKRMLRLGGEL